MARSDLADGVSASAKTTIGRKLVAVVLVGVATTSLLVFAVSAWHETSRYADAKTAEIEGTAAVFATAVADALAADDRIGILKALRAIGRIPSFTHAKVERLDGTTVAELGTAVALAEDPATPILLRRSLEAHAPIVKEGRRIGRLSVLVNTADLRERLIGGLTTGLLAALAAAALGVAVTIRLQRRITDPLHRLTGTMRDISQTDNYRRLVAHTSDDETGTLVEAFNAMMMKIRQRDDRLADHRAKLEQKVEERTHDLQVAKTAAEDANAAKSDFLATMSHEIRTPMNGMLVMAELLSSADLTSRHRRYADVIVKSGQSLLSIINDILDFSKIESGKLDLESVPLDPGEVVDDVLNLFWERAASKGLDLAAYVGADVPEQVEGDPVRLNQILSNLVNNALKFTETGHVRVDVTCAEPAPDADGAVLEFSVSDTGIGIPPEKLQTIFESFAQADQSTTRRFGGTGLGLAICKRLVEAMGGTIAVESVEGEGAAFRFTMPARSLAEHDDASAEPAAAVALDEALIVLEPGATRAALTDYAHDVGLRPVPIAPGDVVRTEPGTADVMFADPAILADGERASGKPFVVCVSQLGDSYSDEALSAGKADDVLARPVSRAAFRALVARLRAGAPLGTAALKRQRGRDLPRYSGIRVLVADDSPVNREVIIEALKQLDVEVVLVEDGAAAVEAVRDGSFDLIFMDCSMPVMDGFEATRRIRGHEADKGVPHVPIVALTAHMAGSAADEWQQAGMDDYMTKPFRITDLVACFDKFLPGRAAQGSEPVDAVESAPPPESPASATDSVAPLDMASLPVIDEEVLAAVAGCQQGDGHALVSRVLGLFESHAPNTLLTLVTSAQETNYEAVTDAAHALKSMCRNIGARRLAEACGALEASARKGQIEASVEQFTLLHDELAAALARIAEIKAETSDREQRAGLE